MENRTTKRLRGRIEINPTENLENGAGGERAGALSRVEKGREPVPLNALFLLIVSAAVFIGGTLIWLKGPLWWLGGVLPVAGFALPTLIWASAGKRMKLVLPSHHLSMKKTVAAVAIAAGGSLSGLAASGILSRFPGASGEEKLLLEWITRVPHLEQVLFFVVIPALCEEILFRGGVLASFRRWPPATACVASGAVFALFHASLYRFIPVAILGTALATVVVKTGNIWLAVLGHALHNGAVLLAVQSAGGVSVKPVMWSAVAALAVTGIVLFVAGCLMDVGSGSQPMNDFPLQQL